MSDTQLSEPQAEEVSLPVTSRLDWREIMLVLGAGAAGGFASWVYGKVFHQPVPGGVWAIPTAVFLGAFAAGIAVYVLTNTNTAQIARTLFFAALCGFMWKPVCDAGKAFIQQAVQQKQDAAVDEESNQAVALAESLSNTPPAQLAAKLEQIDDAATSALDSLRQVNSPKLRRTVETRVSTALTMVELAAPKDPPTASKVLRSVGEAAAKNQAPKAAVAAEGALATLAARNPAFEAAHVQLRTNIASTVSGRYRLNLAPRPQ